MHRARHLCVCAGPSRSDPSAHASARHLRPCIQRARSHFPRISISSTTLTHRRASSASSTAVVPHRSEIAPVRLEAGNGNGKPLSDGGGRGKALAPISVVQTGTGLATRALRNAEPLASLVRPQPDYALQGTPARSPRTPPATWTWPFRGEHSYHRAMLPSSCSPA